MFCLRLGTCRATVGVLRPETPCVWPFRRVTFLRTEVFIREPLLIGDVSEHCPHHMSTRVTSDPPPLHEACALCLWVTWLPVMFTVQGRPHPPPKYNIHIYIYIYIQYTRVCKPPLWGVILRPLYGCVSVNLSWEAYGLWMLVLWQRKRKVQ